MTNQPNTIPGGYLLQPRAIKDSDISVAPPHVREIWAYLLREANSRDSQYGRYTMKRGQLFKSYSDIREGTKWYVGYRKMTYNENQTKKTMKFLRETGRITTTKELGGVLITICKYDYYQTPQNYERTTSDTNERTNVELREVGSSPDITRSIKEDKKYKERKKIDRDSFVSEDFKPIWAEWLLYKDQKRERYTNTKSAEAAYKHLLLLSDNNPIKAGRLVDQSVRHEWKGIFPLEDEQKNGKYINGKPVRGKSLADITYEQSQKGKL